MEPGDRIGGYQLEEMLGVGGMGEVWRALQVELERPVALKCMRSEALDHADGLLRFRREMRLHASLQHPNLVPVFDGGDLEGAPFLVMELVTGGSLRQLLKSGALLEPARVLSLLTDIAAATAYLHAKGVIHRDLKPANILLDEKGVPKVTDFGLSRSSSMTALTQANQALGTPAYLPPEVLLGEPVTETGDVYAIGIIAWECFARRIPFQSISFPELAREITSGKREPLAQAVPDLDPGVYQVVEDCLETHPGKRPSAAELETRLRRLIEVTKGRRTAKIRRVTASARLPSQLVPVASASGGRRRATAVAVVMTLALGLAWLRMGNGKPAGPLVASASPTPATPATPDPASSPTAPLREALVAKYRQRLLSFHPVVHIAPPGKPRGSLDRMVRLIAAPAPEETLAALFLHLPGTTAGPATLRIAGDPAPSGVLVNEQPVSPDATGAWIVPPTILRAGLNAIVAAGAARGARMEVTPPGPPDLESRNEWVPPMTRDVIAEMPDLENYDSIGDNELKLRQGLEQVAKGRDQPALRLWIAAKRLTLARTRYHFKGESGLVIVGAATGKRPEGQEGPIEESSEELLAMAIRDVESVLAKYPRAGYAWVLLSMQLALAGLESEAFQAVRYVTLLERDLDGSMAWGTPFAIVDEQIVRGKARPERILEAIEGLRVQEEFPGEPRRKKEIEWLTRNLPPTTRP